MRFSKFLIGVSLCLLCATPLFAQESSGYPKERAILGAQNLPEMTVFETKNCVAIMDIAVQSAKHHNSSEEVLSGNKFLVEVFVESMKLKTGVYEDYESMVKSAGFTQAINSMSKSRPSRVSNYMDEASKPCVESVMTAVQRVQEASH